MLVEAKISRETILQLLYEHYQLDTVNLEFIPKGECSWNYKVSEDGKNYFLKIHTDLALSLERFTLLAQIYEKAHIEEILHPLKTKNGDAYVWLEKYPVVLFPYIDGKNGFEKPFSETARFQIGQALAKLHQATEAVEDYEVKEDFIFPYTNHLEELLKIKSWKNDYQKQTIELLQTNKQNILDSLNELEIIGQKIREKNPELVICHGDIHDGNILLDKEGKVHIIDWDDVKMAPKEKDLNYVKAFSETMKGYKSVMGEMEINQEIIDYYGVRWTISEIYDWSNRILTEEHEEVECKRFLEGLKKEIQDITL